MDVPSLDLLLPPAIAAKAEELGATKARLPLRQMFLLAVLAGAFISQGAIFSTVAGVGVADHLGFGLSRVVAGITFSLGLILVVIAGAELFTGNNLLVMAWAGGRITTAEVVCNWSIVFLGNFAGALATAWLMVAVGQHQFGGGQVGQAMLRIAAMKCSLSPTQAFFSGIACNALVCLAVWLAYSGRTTADKILAIVPPITAFVAAGFEHCVANMYFIPVAIFALHSAAPPVTGELPVHTITWQAFFFRNLLPVTLGNIVGGAGLVGLIYWTIYGRRAEPR